MFEERTYKGSKKITDFTGFEFKQLMRESFIEAMISYEEIREGYVNPPEPVYEEGTPKADYDIVAARIVGKTDSAINSALEKNFKTHEQITDFLEWLSERYDVDVQEFEGTIYVNSVETKR